MRYLASHSSAVTAVTGLHNLRRGIEHALYCYERIVHVHVAFARCLCDLGTVRYKRRGLVCNYGLLVEIFVCANSRTHVNWVLRVRILWRLESCPPCMAGDTRPEQDAFVGATHGIVPEKAPSRPSSLLAPDMPPSMELPPWRSCQQWPRPTNSVVASVVFRVGRDGGARTRQHHAPHVRVEVREVRSISPGASPRTRYLPVAPCPPVSRLGPPSLPGVH